MKTALDSVASHVEIKPFPDPFASVSATLNPSVLKFATVLLKNVFELTLKLEFLSKQYRCFTVTPDQQREYAKMLAACCRALLRLSLEYDEELQDALTVHLSALQQVAEATAMAASPPRVTDLAQTRPISASTPVIAPTITVAAPVIIPAPSSVSPPVPNVTKSTTTPPEQPVQQQIPPAPAAVTQSQSALATQQAKQHRPPGYNLPPLPGQPQAPNPSQNASTTTAPAVADPLVSPPTSPQIVSPHSQSAPPSQSSSPRTPRRPRSGESLQGVLSTVLQNCLVLRGWLLMEQNPGAWTKLWFSNEKNVTTLRFFDSMKESEEKGSIDFMQAVDVAYDTNKAALNPPEKSSRCLYFSLFTYAGQKNFLASSDQELVFWMLGMKGVVAEANRLKRHSEPNMRGGVAKAATLSTATATQPASYPSSAAEEAALLRLDYDYMNNTMDRVLDELEATEVAIRHVTGLRDKLMNEVMMLNKRKEALTAERDVCAAAIEGLELQLASKRGGCACVSVPSSSRWRFKTEDIPGVKAFSRLTIRMKKPQQPQPKAEEAAVVPVGPNAIQEWMLSRAAGPATSIISGEPTAVTLANLDIATCEQGDLAPIIFSTDNPQVGPCIVNFGHSIACRSISCYPLRPTAPAAAAAALPATDTPGAPTATLPTPTAPVIVPASSPYENRKRHGDPICDHFAVKVVSAGPNATRVIVALADGCNWGSGARDASLRASTTFVDYVTRQHHKICFTSHLQDVLLLALNAANDKINDGKASSLISVGTTTMLGGVLMPLKDPSPQASHVFVCVSVGDCKAFHWSHRLQTVTDITASNRQSDDATDPGGRLGPYVKDGPDLRNLQLFQHQCAPEDIVFLVTDGVHDNFDPQSLGDKPSDWGFNCVAWEEARKQNTALLERVKISFRANHMKQVLLGHGSGRVSLTPDRVCEALLEHCYKITTVQREWMEQNPQKRMTEDYAQFPGKLDHTTCVAFAVPPVQQ
eukprot:TRINITY_DN3443_c0_g1_i1.p1 TRINITY_DN3443_c0_g1~~TRINITY_DN3443_c0_g1_i1.p1  ORF type:complete len:1090 (+),score=255.23 TRINITY_DN3443_c0_g1_i1:325-3270(+)